MIGTGYTKEVELRFVADRFEATEVLARFIDVGTSGHASTRKARFLPGGTLVVRNADIGDNDETAIFDGIECAVFSPAPPAGSSTTRLATTRDGHSDLNALPAC